MSKEVNKAKFTTKWCSESRASYPFVWMCAYVCRN